MLQGLPTNVPSEGAVPGQLKAQKTPPRIQQLDSIRGLAALSVVLQHCLYVFPLLFDDTTGQKNFWLLNLFKYSPLHLFWAGSQAVFLFFLLSGFVLSLPYYRTQKVSYPAFIIKRVCRLYLPYVAALATAVLFDVWCSRHGISALSGWFNSVWGEEPSANLVFQHVLLIDHFDTTKIDPVIWSLVQEMRVSLLFPLLMLLIKRYHVLFLCAMMLVFYIVGELAHPLYDGATTLEVVAFFLLGALLAKYRLLLVSLYQRMSRSAHYLVFACALLCYTAPWWLFPVKALQAAPVITDLLCVVGGALFIIQALASDHVSRILHMPSLVFLGRISFSVYLYHVIILAAAINLFYGAVNLWLILCGVVVTTLAVGCGAYYGIEKPSIALGHLLTGKKRSWSRQSSNASSQLSA